VTTAPLRSARAVADLSAGLILAQVEIAAPPERVFTAMSSAEIAEWWGSPETYRVTRWTGDVRVGGWWRSEGASADGRTFAVYGEILEYDPPRLLVQTWRYERNPESTTTVRIQQIPGGSRVTIRHDGFTDAMDCEGHARGWERVFGWLTAHVSGARQ